MDGRLESLWRALGARTDYESCARPRAARFRLDGMERLVAALGHPERSYAVLHVAGSKGKGTLAHALAYGLRGAGFRTGLYLSPHLSDWRERIQVDGAFAPDAVLADALQAVLARAEEGATFFDLLTAAAFETFRRCAVEIAVIEVGLGGRADSTNVVAPLAAAVTSIEAEHLEVLGPTLAHVAAEKGGVFKPGVALWRGEDVPPEARVVLERRAIEVGGELRDASARPVPRGLAEHPLPHVRRLGALAVAMLAVTRAPWSRAADVLAAAPASAWQFPGRWETRALPGGRTALFDVAHSERSLRAVLTAFRARHPDAASRGVVFALRDETDPDALAHALGPAPDGERWWTARAGDHPRSADPQRLARAFGAQALAAPALPDGVPHLLVTGSTYLVGALRPATTPLRAEESLAR
jgi:dihydrofolate synthase/folylpolyglutamate synthase